ncbi:DUF1648 domain-containing protein [Glutamicibacter uratoxydans]|uniref:DUF1648 domain-containing protein n=1 Tax=Glutamicibacter uratoxydans TaxID=43667 RepID=UPI003D6E4EB5
MNHLPHRQENFVRQGSAGFSSIAWVPVARRWAWVLIWGFTAAMLLRFPFLPPTVVTHYNFLGQPDGYGPRWTVLVLGAVLLPLFYLISFLSKRTDLHNHARFVPAERAEKFHQNAERTCVRLLLFLVVSYALLVLGYFGIPLTGLLLPTVTVMTIWALIDGLKGYGS